MMQLSRTSLAGRARSRQSGGAWCAAVCTLLVLAAWTLAVLPPSLGAVELDRIDLDRYKQLRETERYQMDVAEQYYRQNNWKVALAEYEKFLSLYERSVGAPYAQLKWSICQLNLRRSHTAIKEGFQSVIDYWPDSPDAIAATYYIGKAYKDMGELNHAKRAYRKLLQADGEHLAAAYAMMDLIDITTIEDDPNTRVALWKQLTFEVPREGAAKPLCEKSSQDLASYYLQQGVLDQALQALATTYTDEKLLPQYLVHFGQGPLQTLTGNDESRSKGEKLAEQAVAFIQQQMPTDLAEPEERERARQYWLYTVQLEQAARRHEQVLKRYQQMLDKFGVDDDLLGRLGQWYKSQDRWDDARSTYARFADKPQGQHQIALSYRQQQQLDPAVEIYRRLAAQDADNEARWTAETAATYRELRQFPEAIAIYEQLLQLDPENTEQWRWLIATAYQESGQYKQAIAHYRQSERFPDNYIQMAACHRQLEEYNEALLLYNQVVGGAPNHAPWAALQVGYTHEQAGHKEQAIKAFQRVCKTYPQNSHASQAHAHLQNEYKITVTLGGATQGE